VFAVLRVAVLAAVVALAITVLAWLITRERRWKRLSWQVFRYSVYGLLLVLILFAGEALLH
jgi:cell division protein FtsW (lipid II flippase)